MSGQCSNEGESSGSNWIYPQHGRSCRDGRDSFTEGLGTEGLLSNIDHPIHYTQGSIECIDAIEAALTPEEFRGYCKGNAFKYIWREQYKGQDESIDKASWYLGRI